MLSVYAHDTNTHSHVIHTCLNTKFEKIHTHIHTYLHIPHQPQIPAWVTTCSVSYEEEDTCVSYEEDDTCVLYEEEDTSVSYEEEDHACHMRRRIQVSYEEEDTCVI